MPTNQDAFASELQRAFAEEARELLRRIEATTHRIRDSHEEARRDLWPGLLRLLHTLKGAAAAVGHGRYKDEVHALETTVSSHEAGRTPFDRAAFDAFMVTVDTLRGLTSDLAPEATEATGPATPGAADTTAGAGTELGEATEILRVKPERIDALYNLVGELVVTRLRQDALTDQIRCLRERSVDVGEALEGLQLALGPVRRALPTSLWTAVNDRLKHLASAAREAQKETFSVAKEAPMLEAHTASVVSMLTDCISAIRLMPLGPFFEEYRRVLREAARECHKEVRMEIRAEGAELDRHVLLQLRDPLLHLVRNAVVHGVESPDDRIRTQKSEVGLVVVEAICEGSWVEIRIADDGRGIDAKKVLERGRGAGLTERTEADEEHLLEILTQPGFSTYGKVDGLAGRGVGLDVVASTVTDLKGTLTLENLPGLGSAFRLRVPVSATTTQGLVVSAEGHLFGVLLQDVERTVRIAEEDIFRLEGHEAIEVDGQPVALTALGELLGLGGAERARLIGKHPAVVLRRARARLVVLVDDIPGEQALVVKPVPENVSCARYIQGGAVMPDNSVLLVLQVAELFARASGRPQRGAPPAEERTTRRVLVVDDSVTMRTLQRSILSSAGYKVTVAQNGREALEELERIGGTDLIVTDLQMPEMDGVSLSRAIRASDAPHTPIVMVTSVGDPEERRRALDAGADAYVVKADFEQGAFLETVARFLAQ